jgi:hypothetical protein
MVGDLSMAQRPVFCVIEVDYRNRRNWGHWSELSGTGGIPEEEQRPSSGRPPGQLAPPGAYEVGDNISWDRVGAVVPRRTLWRDRMQELQFAINLKRDVELAQGVMLNMRTTAALLQVTCGRWSRCIIETSGWMTSIIRTVYRHPLLS